MSETTLKYSEIRDEIRTGDLILFKGRSFWSRVIQFRTLSRFSHCGFALWLHDEDHKHRRLMLVESKEAIGARMVPLTDAMRRGSDVHWFPLEDYDEVDRDAVFVFTMTSLGSPYAPVWQFVRSFGLVTRWLCDRWHINANIAGRSRFCSEYVAEALKWMGYRHSIILSPPEVVPGDLPELPFVSNRGRIVL